MADPLGLMKLEETSPSQPMRAPRGFRWLLLALGTLSAGVGLLGIWLPEASFLYAFVWAGVGFLFLAAFTPRLAPNPLLILSSSCLAFFAGCVLFACLRLDLFLTLRNLVLTISSPAVGIWRFDPRYGYSHVPNSSGVQKTAVYEVTYHIDGQGCRVTPDPADPKGEILCLGCSFTFGTGVEDDQTYPAQLATRYWPQYKVRNAGVAGWGTAHAYLVLQDALRKPEKPVLVTYGWIEAHLTRNWIRRGWILDLQRRPISLGTASGPLEWRKHPHFEIKGGRLAFKGVVGPEDAPIDDPSDLARETAITQRLVTEMAALCHAQGIPFVFVCLPTDEGDASLPSYLVDVVQESGTWLVDASGAGRGFNNFDFHPNAATHAAIADVIAGDERIVEWLRR